MRPSALHLLLHWLTAETLQQTLGASAILCSCTVQGKIIKVKDRAFNDQRYFICDQKLAGLGWTERTSWEEGLQKTIDWYLKHGFSSYWEHGDVEVWFVMALRNHYKLKADACSCMCLVHSAFALLRFLCVVITESSCLHLCFPS